MENNYCFLSIKKIHSMGSLQSAHKHNFRELPLKHVDVTKMEDNEELVNETGYDYRELWYNRIKDVELSTGHPVVMRKNSVIAYEILTTFSKEATEFVDMEAWKEANIKWMRETFGEENVISMQLHEDESVPHIHTIVVPIDERGKLCAKSFTGGRSKLFSLQNSYGKAMESVGLRRGEMYSRSEKKNINNYYKQLNAASNKQVPKREENEDVDSYIKRINRYVQDEAVRSLGQIKKMQRSVELALTKKDQMYARYAEAIKLQNDLEESFGGNREMVQKRLRTYRELEKAVPRKSLNAFLDRMLNKFPVSENIRKLKGKKKKEMESEYFSK